MQRILEHRRPWISQPNSSSLARPDSIIFWDCPASSENSHDDQGERSNVDTGYPTKHLTASRENFSKSVVLTRGLFKKPAV